jgi:neutral ceramidase
MKRFIYSLSIILLVSCSSKETDRDSYFYAGIAQSVITPPAGTYMVEPRGKLSTGTHDDLFVRAVALSDGKNKFVIVSFDLIGLTDLLVNNIRNAVFDSAGIKADQLMLACTHTHNSPNTFDVMHALPEDLVEGKSDRDIQWENKMIGIAAGTVKSAINNLKKVSIAQGRVPVQIGFNRRLNKSSNNTIMAPNPNGPILKETDVVFIKDIESEIAVLFSYAAHPVSVHATSTEFTADYPGYAARYIQSKYPGSIAVFLQGCGANVNSTLLGGYEAAESDGDTLGKAVLKSAESIKTVKPCAIFYAQHDFYLPYIDMDKETAELVIKRIDESFEAMKQKNPDFKRDMSQMDLYNWAQKMKYIAENKASYHGVPYEAQAVALGKSLVIIALPDEVFSDYALYLKEHSPFEQTIVLGFTNGVRGYIPSAEAFFLGGYEPLGAQQVYGQPYLLMPACEKVIKTQSMELLNKLWKKYSD